MKYFLFLMFVAAATASGVPFAATTGKPYDACRGRSNKFETYNLPHETDCTKFYKCIGDYAFEVDCPVLKGVQLFFNADLQVCDWDSTNCKGSTGPVQPTTPGGGGTSSSSGSSSTGSSPGSTPNPPPIDGDCSVDPERKRPHPTDKHKYYECENGKLIEKKCLEGHYFNPLIAECDIE